MGCVSKSTRPDIFLLGVGLVGVSIEFGEGYGMYLQTRLGFGSGLDFNHSPPMGRYSKSPLDIKTVTNSNYSFLGCVGI